MFSRRGVRFCHKETARPSASYEDVDSPGGMAGATGGMGVNVVGGGTAFFNKLAAMEDDLNYTHGKEKGDIDDDDDTYEAATPTGSSSPVASPIQPPIYDDAHIPPPQYTRHPSVDENKY